MSSTIASYVIHHCIFLQGAEGAGNLTRFAHAWKPVSKEEEALEGMRGFGYPMHGTPGEPPAAVRML